MQPPEYSNSIDNRPRRADDRRMEDRLSALEQHVATMTVDLAIVRSNYATKQDIADLRAEMGTMKAETATEFGNVHAQLGTMRAETAAEFGKVYAQLGTMRAETAAEFGKIYAHLGTMRAETAAEFGKVYAQLGTMRAETAAEFGTLRAELNTQFWRLVTWMTSAMALMTGGVYFIARYVP